jgi:hypothetical protein
LAETVRIRTKKEKLRRRSCVRSFVLPVTLKANVVGIARGKKERQKNREKNRKKKQ